MSSLPCAPGAPLGQRRSACGILSGGWASRAPATKTRTMGRWLMVFYLIIRVGPLIPPASGVLMETMLLAHRPAPPLAAYVETLWYYDRYQTADHKGRVLPNGRLQIMIDVARGSGAVSGVRSQSVVIDTAAIL